MPLTERDIEALIVALVEGEKRKPSQVAKREVFARYGILGTGKDRALTAIFYSLGRKIGLVDKAIERIADVNVKELDPMVRASVRLAAYALYFNSRDPELPYRIESCVPKILEKLLGREKALEFIAMYSKLRSSRYEPQNIDEELELKYEVSSTLISKLRRVLPPNEVEEFLKAINRIPMFSFRVNTLKATVEEVVKELRREGKDPIISPYVPTVVKFYGPYNYAQSKLLQEGKVVPQDDASAAAALILDPRPGEVVVDMCAAPGGKTTHMGELMKNRGKIYAFDIYDDRIERLKWLLERTGISIVEVFKEDARKAPEILGEEIADKVLLDPPCSSTGALAKHPEARWRLSDEKIQELATLQEELLEAAFKLVKPGGRILYCTCSVLPEEGEELIARFLERHRNRARLIPIEKPFDKGLIPGTMRAWPHRHNTTGFFYALIEKIS